MDTPDLNPHTPDPWETPGGAGRLHRPGTPPEGQWAAIERRMRRERRRRFLLWFFPLALLIIGGGAALLRTYSGPEEQTAVHTANGTAQPAPGKVRSQAAATSQEKGDTQASSTIPGESGTALQPTVSGTASSSEVTSSTSIQEKEAAPAAQPEAESTVPHARPAGAPTSAISTGHPSDKRTASQPSPVFDKRRAAHTRAAIAHPNGAAASKGNEIGTQTLRANPPAEGATALTSPSAAHQEKVEVKASTRQSETAASTPAMQDAPLRPTETIRPQAGQTPAPTTTADANAPATPPADAKGAPAAIPSATPTSSTLTQADTLPKPPTQPPTDSAHAYAKADTAPEKKPRRRSGWYTGAAVLYGVENVRLAAGTTPHYRFTRLGDPLGLHLQQGYAARFGSFSLLADLNLAALYQASRYVTSPGPQSGFTYTANAAGNGLEATPTTTQEHAYHAASLSAGFGLGLAYEPDARLRVAAGVNGWYRQPFGDATYGGNFHRLEGSLRFSAGYYLRPEKVLLELTVRPFSVSGQGLLPPNLQGGTGTLLGLGLTRFW